MNLSSMSEGAEVLFERLAPIPPGHPRSSYPMLPVIGRRTASGEPVRVGSRFLQPDARYTTSGSAAILCALSAAGVGSGDEVLVPAYHCPTMVWPVQLSGATPVFVPMRDDLVIDVDRLRGMATPRTRAVLLPHFFGRVQPAAADVCSWCDERGVVLIEDCAHAFYSLAPHEGPGSFGHFAIASTRKFFAGIEGGAIVANGRVLEVTLPPASLADDLRCAAGVLRLAREYGALPLQRRPATLTSEIAEGSADDEAARKEAAPVGASRAELASSEARRSACRVTRHLLSAEPHDVSAGIRRARWLRWREVVGRVRGVSPFDDTLPGTGVPYVYAARLGAPERSFARLKYAGVQVWRWDRLAVSRCETSRRLALELVQLPCQQSLSDERFDQLLEGFVTTLADTD